MKYENVVKKVFGQMKQAKKHRSDPKLNGSEMQADISVKQPKEGLAGCWIKAKKMLSIIKLSETSTTTQPVLT